MDEIWKDVAGYEGLYQVSNLGRVKRLARRIKDSGKGRHYIGEQIITPKHRDAKRLYVNLFKNGVGKFNSIHRLVALAFIPNPENLPFINHKDENSLNNHANNLEWCTPKYNSNYGTAIQRARANRNYKEMPDKIRIARNTPMVDQYDTDGNFIKTWPSISVAGKALGNTHSHIARCCQDHWRTAYGYKWRLRKREP